MILCTGPNASGPTPTLNARRSARQQRGTALLVLSLLALLAFPAAGHAGTYSIVPVADLYVRSDDAGTNFGAASRIGARAATKEKRRSYLRFNVQIPESEAVTRATLSVVSLTSGSGVALRGVSDSSWDEHTTTWTDAPEFGTPVAVTSGFGKSQTITMDATSLIAGSGLVSMATTTASGTLQSFASRETATRAPRLVVETAAAPVVVDPPLAPPAPAPAIDVVAPDTTITAGVPDLTLATTAAFDFTGSDDVTPSNDLAFQCALDGGPYSTCSAPTTQAPLTVGEHQFDVRAVDAAGNVDTTPATEFWTVAPDTSAPSVPAGLAATAGSQSVALTWNASSDNVAVTGYRVYRAGVLVGSPTATSFSDTGLTNGTNYSYSVRAIDAAGNLSASSATVNATPVAPPDTSAPSVPAGLAATAGSQSVALTWSASSDNVAVAGYRVYRGGVLVGSPTGTSFSDTGLANGTSYSYSVRAIDAAGNQSGFSASVSATPVAPPAGTTCAAFGPYDALNQPGSCWTRYATTSAFNRPVPASPRLFASNGTTSAKMVSRLISWGSAQSLIAGQTGSADWWHPLYYSKSTDPLYTIRCTQWTSSCELEGRQVRIPVGAKPAGGGDGHMTVIDQATGTEYDMWQAATPSGSGGTLNISHGGITQIDGDGLGSNATAAHFGLAAGTIRGADMQAGAIRHALFAQIKCSGGYAVAPAAAGTTAAPCTTFGLSNQDAPPMGARLWLDLTSAQIDALAVPAWKKTILKAMHDYGIIVGDTNGGNQAWGIQAESEQGYASFGRSSYWRTLGASVNAGSYGGGYVFDIQSGVDWARYLRVLDPCVSQGTC